MNSIIISPNVKEPYLCLVKKGNIVKHSIEKHESARYPLWSISSLLENEEGKANLVVIGKPIILIRNLIYMHCFVFPISPFEFIKDIYFVFEQIIDPAKKLEQMDLSRGSKVKDKIKFEKAFYIRVDDAVAFHFNDRKSGAIITCLTDVFEGSSFCIYEQGRKFPLMIKEAGILNSLSTLLQLRSSSGSLPDIKMTPSGFNLGRKHIRIKDSRLVCESYGKSNKELLKKAFFKIIQPLLDSYKKIQVISDSDISSITKNIKGLNFTYITAEEKMRACCRYAIEKT